MNETRENKNVFDTTATIKSAGSYSKMADGLNSLNTSRGGEKGLKGFAFEEMHAADVRVKGHTCEVVNNNGTSDLLIDGDPVQLKMGYKNSQPKWSEGYDTVVVDKGNSQLANKASKAGYKVEESAISEAEAKTLSDAMRMESTITKQSTAPITGTLVSSHMAGKTAAGLTAKFTVPFQAGANICDVLSGDKSVEEAVVDTVVDGAAAVGTAYLSTAALTAATTAATAVGTAAAETAVGAAVVAAASTATTAIAGTAVGGAALAAAGAVGGAATTAVAMVAAAPVLPVVAVAAGIGFIGSAISKIFEW